MRVELGEHCKFGGGRRGIGAVHGLTQIAKLAIEFGGVVGFVLGSLGIYLNQFLFDGADFLAQVAGSRCHRLSIVPPCNPPFERLKLSSQIANGQDGFIHLVLAVAQFEHKFKLFA